jgi:hypothetical protein
MKEKLANLVFITAMLGLAFVIGCEFKNAEICEKNPRYEYLYDLGKCKLKS